MIKSKTVSQKSISYEDLEYLPHNFLAEKLILSCLLIRPELIETIITQLVDEAFYFKNHQELYRVITYRVNNNLPVDVVKLAKFLESQGLVEKIGGPKVLFELISITPDISYLSEYIKIVNEKFLRRSLLKIGYEIINSSYVANISSETLLKDLETKLFSLTKKTRKRPVINSAKLLEDLFSELIEKFTHPKLIGLESGFPSLDSITQGFQKSDLIVIAGRPSMGKTALSLNIGLNILKHSRLPIVIFSLEMSKEQLLYRLLAMESNINSRKLKNGQLSENDWIKLNKIIKILSKLPLVIDDSPNLSIQDLRFKIKQILLEQETLGLIIIDYLQLLQSLNRQNTTRTEELAHITRTLKNIAKEFNIPIISLSQLSRNVENRWNQTPMLADLRESGSIEQDADLVLMLANPQNTPVIQGHDGAKKSIELIVAKHRNGPTGIVSLAFDGKHTKFSEKVS